MFIDNCSWFIDNCPLVIVYQNWSKYESLDYWVGWRDVAGDGRFAPGKSHA